MTKSLVLTALLTLFVLAVEVAPATATVHRYLSCTEKKECKTASVGTTFEGTEGEFVIKDEKGSVINKCVLSVKGKIVDPITEKENDELESAVTSVTLTKCTNSELEAASLPWVASIDAPEYEAADAWEVTPWAFKLFGCNYSIGGTHTMLETNTLINRSIFTSGTGTVLKEGAPNLICKGLLNDSYSLWTHLASDPGLADAKFLEIE
jgi:uncharacterized membrane protein